MGKTGKEQTWENIAVPRPPEEKKSFTANIPHFNYSLPMSERKDRFKVFSWQFKPKQEEQNSAFDHAAYKRILLINIGAVHPPRPAFQEQKKRKIQFSYFKAFWQELDTEVYSFNICNVSFMESDVHQIVWFEHETLQV